MINAYSVTVGIPTKDRFEDLKKCIYSLVQQTYLPREIIIVDDGCLTIDQQEECRKIIEPKIQYIYIRKDKPNLSTSKNLIAKLAKGNLVLILDDDTVLDCEYIKELVAVFSKDSSQKIAAIGGLLINQRKVPMLEKIWKRLFILDSGIPGDITCTMFETRLSNTQFEYKVKWLPGHNTMFRLNILKEFPFEEFQGGRNALEDVELALRIGKNYDFMVTPKAKIYHYPSLKGRESKFTTGFKHAYNRCLIFKKYGKKGFNRVLFFWSFFGYISGLLLKGRFAMAKGNIMGLYKFIKDEIRKLNTQFIIS